MSNPTQIPTRPYLVRAIYEWTQDHQLTPYLLVNADAPQVMVPRQYVKDGQIVLNIAAHAVQGLVIGNDDIRFQARFGGVSQQLYVPMYAVLGLYARENGQGLFFDPQEYADQPMPVAQEDSAPATQQETAAEPSKKPSLRILD